jgi:adenylate cyclase
MAKEIEKKFLIEQAIPWDLGERKLIKQGYVLLEKNKQLRVRVIDHQSFICLKYTKGDVRDEYEYEIPLLDGLEILGKCKFKLEKVRNIISPHNHQYVIDIDTYPNGLVVAEVEFKTKEDFDNFKPLDWFGKEITGVKEYSNITLAKQKLHF